MFNNVAGSAVVLSQVTQCKHMLLCSSPCCLFYGLLLIVRSLHRQR